MKHALGAVLLAGLPALAYAQQPAQVPPLLQANAAAAAAAAANAGPSDHPASAASATASAGTGAPQAVGGAGANAPASTVPAGMPPPLRLLSPSAPLNAKEKHGVGLARRWANARYMPHADADGVIRFPYGATLPTVVCAPLQVCDLALQPGEIVNNVNLGDKVRWIVLPGMSGSSAGQVTHIIIKATDAGLVSSMTILTNRRSYAVKLVSTQTQWMPLVAFSYPDDMQAQWSAYHMIAAMGTAGSTGRASSGSFTGENAGALDFSYRLSGDHPSWRPLRVYSDGSKTYIQFPQPVVFGSAPALVGLGNDGGWFAGASKQVLNYRVAGDRYVVDQVLDRAELVSGVGDDQTRVLVTREAAR